MYMINKPHTPANFKKAYSYLHQVALRNEQVDWDFVSHKSDLMADLLLLRIMHLVVHDKV